MLQGIVVKAYNSFYYVQTGNKTVVCTIRGRFKKERFVLVVGDEVKYSMVGDDKGVIEEILPRRNMLRRPMVANVDQVILTFAAVNPDLNPSLIDRFLAIVELSHLETILCVNKIDLANIDELHPISEVYLQAGYPVILLSAKSGQGISLLRKKLYERISVFAGPSGAGKSTILNAVQPGLELVTGEVSEKIGRGKHTTRYAQLLPLAGGGFVVDTPGFSLAEFDDIDESELADCFPEIASLAPHCKFSSCLHYKEAQCAVKQAVLEGKIARQRYNSYLEMLEELRANKKGY